MWGICRASWQPEQKFGCCSQRNWSGSTVLPLWCLCILQKLHCDSTNASCYVRCKREKKEMQIYIHFAHADRVMWNWVSGLPLRRLTPSASGPLPGEESWTLWRNMTPTLSGAGCQWLGDPSSWKTSWFNGLAFQPGGISTSTGKQRNFTERVEQAR